MSKELIARLRREGDGVMSRREKTMIADRIEGLEQHLAATIDILEQTRVERDALQADNARLREALKHYAQEDIRNARHYPPEFAKEALAATPEQSLAEYRNKVIEECAKRAEAYAYMSQNFNALAEELRAMKEQP